MSHFCKRSDALSQQCFLQHSHTLYSDLYKNYKCTIQRYYSSLEIKLLNFTRHSPVDTITALTKLT